MQLLYTQEIEKAEREHHTLLELARQGDADRACELLRTHIQEACEGIVELLEEHSRRIEKA